MNSLQETWDWFTNGENWRGVSGIPHRLVEHIVISAESIGLALLIALPIGLTLGHLHRAGILAISVSNVGRAVPSLALLVIFAQIFGTTSKIPIVLAMVALAVPPVLTNTYVGVTDVDRGVVEAARGMGLSGRQILFRVEMPLAMPLIMGAVRTSSVMVVATVTLAAVLPQGGLGRYIIDGRAQGDYGELFGGAILVAALAILTELGLGLVQRLSSPVDRARGAALPGASATQATEAHSTL